MTLVVMFGPPGAGKGTQAKILAEGTGYLHVSTGDILREAVAAETEFGLLAKEYMSRGELVPDNIVNGTVKEKLKTEAEASGLIFDGFPRNCDQAVEFDKMLAATGIKIDMVINIDVETSLLLRRLTGRRVCRTCQTTYHVDNLAGKEKCVCGGDLVQRRDDNAEVIEQRLKVYVEQTEPLIKYYTGKGLLKNIDGNGSVGNIASAIKELIG